MKIAVTVFLILSFTQLCAQTKPVSFAAIDKRVKTIQSSSADSLARQLTSPYKTDLEKVRAIFRWITENIAYDTEAYHDPAGIYPGMWQPILSLSDEENRRIYNDKIIRYVLLGKKAVCDGYSRLFKTLCDYSNIKCEIITGYIRWATDPIGAMTNRQHAWNAVYINESWKLIDATWASGYCNAEVTEFTRHYDEFFFCANPVEFFNDHFPEDKKWSFLPNTPSLYQFYNFPFYYPTFYHSKITSLTPTSGFINVPKKNRLVQIEIETSEPIKELYVYESPYTEDSTSSRTYVDSFTVEKVSIPGASSRESTTNHIIYSYEVRSGKANRLDIMFNDKLILTYGLKFER